jgi:hypothetical protein
VPLECAVQDASLECAVQDESFECAEKLEAPSLTGICFVI